MPMYNSWRIPEGNVIDVKDSSGNVIWRPTKLYVSLGDSIAAGHSIDSNWETNYGTGSQYGSNGRQSTVIVPNSYTDLIRNDLKISAISFAKSGDRVDDLIAKLDQTPVRTAISNASIVTICIGANDILGEVNDSVLGDYIEYGNPSLDALGNTIQANLDRLADNSNANSYRALFDKLNSINPKAKCVFTTVYNPYKYLHLDEGRNGFFYHLLNVIPQMEMFGFDIDNLIKDGLLDTEIIQLLFNRVNALSAWVETYVEKLNNVLKTKINEYNNSNFIVADTKKLYDTFPDRPYSAPKHYNDLVNVEYTSEYETDDMDWGALWRDSDAGTYWWNLTTKYVSLSGIDMEGLAAELVGDVVEKIIVPDLDPHPEAYGQYVLKRSFADTIGYQSLDRYNITLNANGGSGTMSTKEIVGVDSLPSFTNIPTNEFVGATGYRFLGWNTAAGGGGTSYSNGQLVSINSNLNLYAQWSNIYTITYKHTNHTGGLYGDNETGHKECYALWIAGTEQADFGKFSEGTQRTIPVAYGTRVGVVVSGYNPSEITYDDADTDVYWNGVSVAQGYGDTPAMYEFTLVGDVTIDFQWKISGSLITFDAKSWEDCYITTHY